MLYKFSGISESYGKINNVQKRISVFLFYLGFPYFSKLKISRQTQNISLS
jgi:hypothetical protein